MSQNLFTTPSTRREWLRRMAALGLLVPATDSMAASSATLRTFHVCLSPTIVVADPDLLKTVQQAGVGSVWLAGFFYGHHPYSASLLRQARKCVEDAGMAAHLINIPLGHPGDSLGSSDGGFPLTPPVHWQTGRTADGRAYAGTSHHPPATEENAAALQQLRKQGFKRCFLDDDFRLARSPGEIGGCYCAQHRQRFLGSGGYPAGRWDELLDDVRSRRLTPLLHSWTEFTCDELTGSFQAQEKGFGRELGIMVMYLGAEKAGIRLKDYVQVPFRVGELMFDDASFGTVKGKTDELFSALFHRRYASPSKAFSETTAYPANRLSADNMAAKLAISTLADVRNTMFMSGLTPFPREHWATLRPAIKTQAKIHHEVAGHRPKGPFKHYWGEAQRRVGNDQPFSLWLATGVPFEVVEEPFGEGWTFLSDFDAKAFASDSSAGTPRVICRDSASASPKGSRTVREELAGLFALKHELRDHLRKVPHILEDEPAVCAWYPGARRVLVWNLSTAPRNLTLAFGENRRGFTVGPLALESLSY